MNSILSIGLSGLRHYLTKLGNAANNAANVNTDGFKAAGIESREIVTAGRASSGRESARGAGVATYSMSKDFSRGSPIETGNPLDLAIDGDGFFPLRNPNGGISFTRNGAFKVSADGQIVDSAGNSLEPGIAAPGGTSGVSISNDGRVRAEIPGQNAPAEIGRLELARFANPAGLKSLGGGRFTPTAASGDPVTGFPGEEALGGILQGFLESSNVDIIDTQVDLITSQRAFQANAAGIRTADENLGTIINLKR